MVEMASAWVLPANSQHRREPARPTKLRQTDFDSQFDWRTVFYDCFRISNTQVMLLGPPLNRFPGILESLTINSSPAEKQCRYTVEHKFTAGFANHRTDNLCRILVEVPAGDTCLRLHSAAGQTTMGILPNGRELFRGRRVLFTLSKNNHPQWICDWMRFHRDIQSADAVLLFDNSSTAYSAASLLEQMQKVSGFHAMSVVAWPYKYGPQGVGRGTWDSQFCQNGAMEDARWRFLTDASGVLNCDIDELVLSREGNLFEKAAASEAGYVRFAGRWVSSSTAAGEFTPRHRESLLPLSPQRRWRGLRLEDASLCPAKWALVPSRCPTEAYWSVHEVVGMRAPAMKQDDTSYRHFTRIGTDWKNNRHSIDKGAKQQTGEIELREAFDRVRWEL